MSAFSPPPTLFYKLSPPVQREDRVPCPVGSPRPSILPPDLGRYASKKNKILKS